VQQARPASSGQRCYTQHDARIPFLCAKDYRSDTLRAQNIGRGMWLPEEAHRQVNACIAQRWKHV
jgi:hypothetical protein